LVKLSRNARKDEVINDNLINISKPPSTDGYAKKTRSLRQKSGKKPGGQEGHAGSRRHFVQMPDEIIIVRPKKYAHCQASLQQELPAEGYQRRQRIDLPEIKAQVTEYQALDVRCPSCQHVTRGTFPEEVRASIQFGPMLNNGSEQDLRMVKVQQKISGTFRSVTGPVAFCRIRGYFSTMAKQGHRLALVARQIFAGVPLSPLGAV